jgi:Fanconi anemia group M protein
MARDIFKNVDPRKYQESIFNTAKEKNTLVVLPTGLGKTLIALMLSKHRLEKYQSSKILFLAPTRPLVAQHKEYFQKILPKIKSHIFTGKINSKKRFELWKESKIIFSTPQCIANDLKRGLDLTEVSLLIEDEVHRCLKNYDYTTVAKAYIENAKNPLVLGLTASPGGDSKIIKKVCRNLNITAVEVRTRQSEDVKPYLQKLETEIIMIDFPEEMNEIRKLLQKILKKKVNELKNRKLLFSSATKKNILELQSRLIKKISAGERHFNVLCGASVCAQAIKLQYSLELLETQSLNSCYLYFQDLFEQAKQKKSKAVQNLIKINEFLLAYSLILKNLGKIEHPKLQKIQEIIKDELKQIEQIKGNQSEKRIIVFSQYRNTVNLINKELNKSKIKSKIFVGQLKKKEIGMNQKEQQQILNLFKQGKINVLVSTSIGEEGLDIPEVDLVIFYEPIPSAIRKIQRTGRTARLKPGKLIIMMTKKTRDETYHWASIYKEKKMHTALKEIDDSFNKKNTKKKEDLTGFI